MAITQQQFEQVFNSSILSENPNLQPSLNQGQDLYFKSKSVSLVAATAVQEIVGLQNNIIPASSSSAFLYKHAASLGIPPILGALPTYGYFSLNSTSNAPNSFTVPTGTILTNSITAIQYQTTNDVFVTSGTILSTVLLPFISILSGLNTYSSPGTLVTFSNPLVLSGGVSISQAVVAPGVVAGSNTPTDLQVNQVVTNYMQNPRGGGSQGDYIKWSLASNPGLITDTVIIPAGGILGQNIIYSAIMGGTSDPNFNINLAYPISRSINNLSDIAITFNYIEGLRPENDNPSVATVSTYEITNIAGGNILNCAISIKVILSPGLTLTTPIVGSNGLTKTVEEWIKYQTRFGILSAPYKGNKVDGLQVILGGSITNALLTGLADTNSLTGYLCSILIDAVLTYTDINISNSLNIPVPMAPAYFIAPTNTTPAYLEIIYDLDVDIITVTLE